MHKETIKELRSLWFHVDFKCERVREGKFVVLYNGLRLSLDTVMTELRRGQLRDTKLVWNQKLLENLLLGLPSLYCSLLLRPYKHARTYSTHISECSYEHIDYL